MFVIPAQAGIQGALDPRLRGDDSQISTLTPASLITLAHLACSTFMNWANFSGVPPPSSAPEAYSRSITSGITSTLLMSSFIRFAIAAGILPGPTRPYQVVASKPGKPDSAMVGTLG
jgi:hypothetical protein